MLAVLLTVTVTAFGSPGVEFGPHMLAQPFWALMLLPSWQVIGEGRRNAWFALSIEAGLLLLTTSAASGLLLLLVGFALATGRGRRMLMSFDPLFALLVVVVLVLPYLIWLIRADTLALPPWPAVADSAAGRCTGRRCSAGCCWRSSGILLLALLNSALVRAHPGRGADHLSAAGRSAGARVRLFVRHRPAAGRKPDLRRCSISTASSAAPGLRC